MVEPINISTLVVKGLTLIFVDESLASTKTCANTKCAVLQWTYIREFNNTMTNITFCYHLAKTC